MPTFGVWEWIIILTIFVIFFGAGKLGNVGGALRRSIDNFKQTAGTPPAEPPDVGPEHKERAEAQPRPA